MTAFSFTLRLFCLVSLSFLHASVQASQLLAATDINGDGIIQLEERPDCEIDSFGDSGINLFVEFWMEGIDDGKNRVGGDLLLTILETIRDNGFEIPFPQREIRILEK